jgi:hypothetical protein
MRGNRTTSCLPDLGATWKWLTPHLMARNGSFCCAQSAVALGLLASIAAYCMPHVTSDDMDLVFKGTAENALLALVSSVRAYFQSTQTRELLTSPDVNGKKGEDSSWSELLTTSRAPSNLVVSRISELPLVNRWCMLAANVRI